MKNFVVSQERKQANGGKERGGRGGEGGKERGGREGEREGREGRREGRRVGREGGREGREGRREGRRVGGIYLMYQPLKGLQILTKKFYLFTNAKRNSASRESKVT